MFRLSDVYLSEQAWPPVKEHIRRSLAAASAHLKSPSSPPPRLIEVRATPLTYEAVASHADLYCCPLGRQIFTGLPSGPRYPNNIGFCGVQLGSFFIHNLPYTAPSIREETDRMGLEKIHVKQGYTRCNLVVVSGAAGSFRPSKESPVEKPAVITSDRGLIRVLSSLPVDVLPIRQGYVELPGFPYGFLGGASGCLGREILFNGDLSLHPDFEEICRFIRDRGKIPRWFSGLPLRDVGSIITLV